MRDELIIHGGVVFDAVINYFDKFSDDIFVIGSGLCVIIFTMWLWLWFSNRRKYHNLKHAIPADVVKSYLDSVIQNSTSLKSQLFRGGGLDLGNVPSVMPLNNLFGGEGLAISGAPSTALMEELNQRKAQVASLEAQLASSQGAHRELEAKLNQTLANLSSAEAKIKELEALLAQQKTSGGGGSDAALKSELTMVSKERDELRDRLKEFEIIADDLANLKRLQQENEQLKRSLAAQGGKIPQIETSAPTPAPMSQADVSDLFEDLGQTASSSTASDNSALEEFLTAPTDTEYAQEPVEEEMLSLDSSDAPAEEAHASEDSMIAASESDKPKSEKTPEDLLSEFEKMLG